ncbi:MAG TPA: hypothetical protein VK548_26500 [Candidatus Acidoferrum sp.]|nr:hypothetical protein [Candidatus Acidoferrum sp.]
MTPLEFLRILLQANGVVGIEAAIDAFEVSHGPALQWVPVGGRENNRGSIEVSGDPGRSLVERITNGIDAALEAEHSLHGGRPDCRSPREAATAWLNVPETGLSELTTRQRQQLADRVTIKLQVGEDRNSRTVEIRDRGIGLTPEQMPRTILSLGESNKLQKHYLAGTYGQGGSSTFAASRYTLIASRVGNNPVVGFTVVRFLDLPPEDYKTGHYVYLTQNGNVPFAELPLAEFPAGTAARHYGYDLSGYPSPLGPNSLYGLLNQVLFDPILPVWLESEVHRYRRVIKGSRNALNGAVDEGDEERRGPSLSHHVRLFYITIADFGRIGIEYWVLSAPTRANKRPSAAFVNPIRPIILTIHGQNHGELAGTLIKKQAELPYLAQRLICHIDCNSLTPTAKRALFVSTREDTRRGVVHALIQEELIRVLRSDDELTRLNNEAREQGHREQDESALQEMRQEVARLLRLQGLSVAEAVGSAIGSGPEHPGRPTHPRGPRPKPQPIELHEPPTFVRIVWEPDEDITFYAQQRRYIRVETDANSTYHNPQNPGASRINIIVSSVDLALRGSTPLESGRMRIILEGMATAAVGATGAVRVELMRPTLPSLADQRSFRIVPPPPVRPAARQVTLPLFETRPVEGPDDAQWSILDWPDDVSAVASSAVTENGKLVIYYSTVFPKYASQRVALERRDTAVAASFTRRYEIWIAVHSLLLYQEQRDRDAAGPQGGQVESDPEVAEIREREERCRVATLSGLFAAREAQLPPETEAE